MPANSDRFKISLSGRIRWLIRLRWLFAAAVFIIAWLVSNVFAVVANPDKLYALALTIVVYNCIFAFMADRTQLDAAGQADPTSLYRMAIVQIVVDLAALTVLLHFSGGLQNPFRSFFVFHMIISSILLSRRAAHLQAGLATALLTAMALLEYYGIIPHNHLTAFDSTNTYQNSIYIFGTLVASSSSFFLAVFLTTSIVSELRQKRDELLETKESLETASRALEEMHKLRAEHLITVTHELKSPLATIEGYLQLLRSSEEMGLDQAKRSSMIERALNRTHGLLELISDLLDLAQAKSLGTAQQMEDVCACHFLQNTVEFFSGTVIRNKLSFVCSLPCSIELNISEDQSFPVSRCRSCKESLIKSNQFNMRHLFTNLVGNAIKYTLECGRVSVELARTDFGLRFSVTDSGIGIPEEEIPRLFNEFYRCSNAKNFDSAGTGLGLVIVKQIVDSQGGKIAVTREPVSGTRFSVFLPFNPDIQKVVTTYS